MQAHPAFDEHFVHNGSLHEEIAVEEKHVGGGTSNKAFLDGFL